ncbi:hypothetical protein OEZ85_010794 [Tetradesmus obliquus]|uniref:EF-hand domain-containing protein n=1 Tax=Tetradesmus obliquus TaxID=3088 RepID=A0ABY8TNC3_TETOB|nr:hypothetical protein OEZ85_010794 [Tetradesmus obliquus]
MRDRDRVQRDAGAAAATERIPTGRRSSIHRSGKGGSNAKKTLATATAASNDDDGGDAAGTFDGAAPTMPGNADAGNEVAAGPLAADAALPTTRQHASSSAADNDDRSPAAAAAAAAGGDAAEEAGCEKEGAGLSFSLDELVAIIMDVMHSKQEEDERCAAAALPRLAPTAHLQRYLSAKVHGDSSAYSHALNALLCGLDAHKQQQPDIAVFCRILAGEVNEDYFQQHCAFSSQLQRLVAAAAAQEQTEQQEQELGACGSALMDQQQLHLLLQDWGTARLILHGKLQQDNVPSAEQQEQLVQLQQAWLADISRHCGTGNSDLNVASVVAALLLWELQQHVSRLETTVEAFRSADQRRCGTLDGSQFRVFCQQLNDAMSDEEVTLLWQELDKQGTGSITFSTLCACLLPVMGDGA